MNFILLSLIFISEIYTQQCPSSACINIPSPVGYLDDTTLKTEIVNASCCYNSVSRTYGCYLPDYQQCSGDGTNTGDVVCYKKGEVPCNGACCPTTSRCEVYEEKNGRKVSACVTKLDNNLGFVIVTVPLMLTLFTIPGLIVLFLYSKDVFQQEDPLDKIAGAISFLIIFFAIFYYYSHVWVYGVVMVVTSGIGLRTLPATDLPTRFVAFFAYLFLFYAVTGWGSGNGWIGGWQSQNLFDVISNCPTYSYFERSPQTSAKWNNQRSAVRAGKDASLINQNWGYCDSGWLFTLAFFTLFQVFFISFMLVSMARRLYQHSSPSPKLHELQQPFITD